MNVLVCDDERSIRVGLADELRDAGYEVEECDDGEAAIALLGKREFDAIICDLIMRKTGGMEVLRYVKEHSPQTAFVLMTAYGTVESAIEALKKGALDYICKPFEMERVLRLFQTIVETLRLKRENMALRNRLEERAQYHNIIGKSKPMQDVFELLETIRDSDVAVLIEGETGTGKQLVAEAIHFHSRRRNAPFITVSCAALPENLLESELFGHEKGAFTGALKARKGRFELAHGGTLFLDEADDMPRTVQTKMLRFLQSGTFEHVGGEQTLQTDVRIIAATKRDLSALVKTGEFREDLFYRLHVVPVGLPPLRERKEDIPLLVDHFAQKYSPAKPVRFSAEVMSHLMGHRWEGNVRELEHVVHKLILLSKDGEIAPALLPGHIKDEIPASAFFSAPDATLPAYIDKMEKAILTQALARCNNSKSQACRLLGIPLPTLKSKLQKFGL